MQEYVRETPLIISHADGVYLFDVRGNRYYDGNSSLWVNIHGHCRKEISQAIKDQLDRVAHSTMLGSTHIPAVELAKRLVEIAPPGLVKVFYSDNGSTAVEVGLKMAFQYWRQSRLPQGDRILFVSYDNAYHGDTIGSVGLGGISLFHGVFGPLLLQRLSVPYPVYSKYTSRETPGEIAGRCLEICETTFRQHPDRIAAVVVEPLIQGAAGMLTQAPGYLKGLRELCDQYDIFMILDEVFTGFGRTGKMFACEWEAVTPDIMAISKGITGGYLPLAATLTTQRVYDGFLGEYAEYRTFFHGHSYTGNPLGCAAALAGLDLFQKDQVLDTIQPKVAYFEKRLDHLFDKSDRVADIHHCGLVAGIDLARSRRRQEFFKIEERMGVKICLALRRKEIWLRPLGNTLILVPPLASTIEHIDHLINSIEECLEAVG